MPYIGNQPGTGVRSRFIYTATASQTTFSGADNNSKTLKYADSAYVDVFLNGVCLVPGTDYTASTKTSIVLIQAASLNDTLEVVAYDIASMSDMSASNGGTFQADVTFAAGADIITATAGTDNVRLGSGAGDSIASGGDRNITIGKNAGTAITTGDRNVGIGHQSLLVNTVGSRSVAVGHNSLSAQNPASATDMYNTAVGHEAGAAITTGINNTLIGGLAGDAITTGGSNTAVGSYSMTTLTTGSNNVAVGTSALDVTTTGSGNTAVGRDALGANTTASNNTVVGYQSFMANTTGTRNVGVGLNAGNDNTTGGFNTFAGAYAGEYCTTGNYNTAIGDASGSTMTTGDSNTFIGQQAGNSVTTGAKNTILGRFNGNQDNFDIRTSNEQIAISNGDGNVRIFCNTQGYTKHKPENVTTYATSGAYHEFSHNNNDTSAIIYYQAHASYVQSVQFTQAQRTASSAYSFAEWRSGAGSDVEFYLRGDGNAYADGSWNGGGADYAEYFEWADGNSDSQDRTGYTVVLDNEKIRIATSDDAAANIIGAVSVNPSVVGDSDINQWKHKYKRDDFGGFIWETYTVTEWTETVVDQEAADEVLDDDGNVVAPAKKQITREVLHTYETDKIPDGVTAPDDAVVSTKDAKENILERKVLNTDYDADAAYVSRENRKEWATIGMMGKLRIRKGQQTGDRWIKMRDVSDTVEEWLVR